MNFFGKLSGMQAALLCVLSACAPAQKPERSPAQTPPPGAEVVEGLKGRYGGNFVLTLPSEPRTFNALIAEDAYAAQIIDLLFPALVTVDAFSLEPKPLLAQSWEVSSDHLSYTVKLRENLKWSDGAPLTADDVLFTFRAIFADEKDPQSGALRPKIATRYRQQLTVGGAPLKVEKLDALTLKFTTAVPYAPFLNDLGFVSILPRHILEKSLEDGTFKYRWTNQTAMASPREIVSSGPFRVFSYRPGERLVLEPNPHYFRFDSQGLRLPYIDYLIFKFVPDTNASLLLFATGQTAASEIPCADLAWVQDAAKTYNFTVYDRGADTSISFIYFNLKEGGGLARHKQAWFKDARFRRAVQHAIDRDGLIRAVFFGKGHPLHSIISPGNRKWYNPDVPVVNYDVQKAKALLKQAGFVMKDGVLFDGEGHAVSFELLAADGSERAAKIATTFIDNMKALGIDVRLSYQDFGTLISRTTDSFNFDAAMLGFTGGGDPSGGKAIYRSDGRLHVWNPSQETPATPWEAQIDRLFNASESEFNPQKRRALIDEMQCVFAAHTPLIMLVGSTSFYGLNNGWRGIRPPPTGPLLWNLDEIWKGDSR